MSIPLFGKRVVISRGSSLGLRRSFERPRFAWDGWGATSYKHRCFRDETGEPTFIEAVGNPPTGTEDVARRFLWRGRYGKKCMYRTGFPSYEFTPSGTLWEHKGFYPSNHVRSYQATRNFFPMSKNKYSIYHRMVGDVQYFYLNEWALDTADGSLSVVSEEGYPCDIEHFRKTGDFYFYNVDYQCHRIYCVKNMMYNEGGVAFVDGDADYLMRYGGKNNDDDPPVVIDPVYDTRFEPWGWGSDTLCEADGSVTFPTYHSTPSGWASDVNCTTDNQPLSGWSNPHPAVTAKDIPGELDYSALFWGFKNGFVWQSAEWAGDQYEYLLPPEQPFDLILKCFVFRFRIVKYLSQKNGDIYETYPDENGRCSEDEVPWKNFGIFGDAYMFI